MADAAPYCPACSLPKVPLDRLYMVGVVTGIAIAEGHALLGSYEAAMGRARWCSEHQAELDRCVVFARAAMRGGR